jgi:hypothetical protein
MHRRDAKSAERFEFLLSAERAESKKAKASLALQDY